MTREYMVAVFVIRGKRKWRFDALLRWFNPEWDGCNLVTVQAEDGKEAKQKAIAEMRKRIDGIPISDEPKGVRFVR